MLIMMEQVECKTESGREVSEGKEDEQPVKKFTQFRGVRMEDILSFPSYPSSTRCNDVDQVILLLLIMIL